MATITLFTPINYARPKSCGEGALSTLSNYFYLGGTQATVVKGNEVQLVNGKVSWYTKALKVTSYVLLFPLTFSLLSIHLVLRSQHRFTVIPSSNKKTSQASISAIPERKLSATTSPTIITTEQPKVITPTPPSSQEKKESITIQPFAATITAQAVERVHHEIIPIPPKEDPFRPFTLKIAEELFLVSSLEEMRQKAREISRQVSDRHIQIRIDIPSYGLEHVQAMLLLDELRTVSEVITTRWNDLFYVVPKRTEEMRENLTIRRYDNGVIEEVRSIGEIGWDYWEGRRLYPNGVIETGRFDGFCFHKGTCVEKEMTIYRLPNTLVNSYSLNRSLMYADIEGEKRLIVIHKKTDFVDGDNDYVQLNEKLIPTLAQILNEENDIRGKNLQEILSGPINCEEFVKFLFETNSIFSLRPYPLQILLKIVQEKGLAINLRQEHPETKETLLDCYSGNAKILIALLAIDPTLIQRTEGSEIAFVRALLAGNKKGASILFSTMEEQKIALLPRELLFKKVAFSEGEVTLEELQTLSHQDQEIVYRLANTHSQLSVVGTMRTLGFGRSEELLMREGPSIFGCNMDALEMHKCLQDFLIRLRSQKLLLTQSEFDQLPAENYIKKERDIGRILGRDYIERKASELGLKHVKVPKKMIVIDDDNTNLMLRTSSDLHIEAPSEGPDGNGITVYAERIKEVNRKITSEEAYELLRLFEATGFSDIHWGNIIIANDGVYIIDTEFTNFWIARFYFEKGRQYAEMAKIVHALPVEQQQTLCDGLNVKVKTYQEQEEELNKQRMNRLRVEQVALQKTGCFYGPCFTFPVNELIT